MIILVILTAAAFFAYSFVRLLLLVFQPDRKNRRRRRGQVPDLMAQGGYVVPPKPIPVLLARDEEVAGAQSEASKLKPPAYGLWRESVVSHDETPTTSFIKGIEADEMDSAWTRTAYSGNAMLMRIQIPGALRHGAVRGRRHMLLMTACPT